MEIYTCFYFIVFTKDQQANEFNAPEEQIQCSNGYNNNNTMLILYLKNL